jgi:hypothetical protein
MLRVVCKGRLIAVVARGVGNDEEPRSLVWGTHVGCSYKTPSRRAPQVGKVSEDSLKAQSEVSSHVFQHDSIRSYCANGISDVGPKVSFIVFALSHSGVAEGLAGVAARHNVYWVNLRPVHACYVSQVWHPWVVGFQDFARCWLDL